MTRFERMDAADLRAEKDDWTAKSLLFAREYLNAVESGQEDWERNMKVALTAALAQVNRLDHLLKVGVGT